LRAIGLFVVINFEGFLLFAFVLKLNCCKLILGPLGSPVFTNQQDTSYITVYKNQDVTLKCEAVGDTPITITWAHKGQVLQSKTSDTHLTLTGVTKEREGFYNCSASNSIRTNSRMFYLHVKGIFVAQMQASF